MKLNITNCLSALCAVLLIAVVAFQFKQQGQFDLLQRQQDTLASVASQQRQDERDAVIKLANQVASLATNLESRMVQGELETKTRTAVITNTLQQQTAVIHRALGKVIPIELPKPLTGKLSALESRIENTNSWPKNPAEANEMLAGLRDLVVQIPPWVEEDLLPRLNAVRWGVQSLQVLQTNANVDGEALATATETFADQISTRPDGGSTNIANALESWKADAMQKFAIYRRESAIKDAKDQLGLPVMTDGPAVWQRLSEWTNEPTCGQEIVELRKKLRASLLKDEVANFTNTTTASVQRLISLTNVALRQAGYFRTMENVTAQRLKLLDEKDVPDSAVTALADLSAYVEARIKAEADKQKQEDAARVRGYQQWALQSISDFRKEFDRALAETKKGDYWGENPAPNYTGAVNAMVRHLVPISPAHLDPAVAKIYSQAFEDGWYKLGLHDVKLQTEVAKKDATTAKKFPQDYQH